MPLRSHRALGAVAIAVGLLLGIAPAPALADASSCSTPTLTQPFSAWGDYNFYTLVPGQSPGNFDGAGWVLGNGAKLVTAPAQNGANTTLLALQNGGWATSPAMCVDPTYQSARMMVRGVYGSPSVDVAVSYLGDSGWSQPQDIGQTSTANTWSPSAVLALAPPAVGWQMARFTLSAYGWFARAQIYDFYIDPYSRG